MSLLHAEYDRLTEGTEKDTELLVRMLDGRYQARLCQPCLPSEKMAVVMGNYRAAKLRRDVLLHRSTPPTDWVHPEVPATPSSFTSKPTLPAVTFLAVVNRHPRDVNIRFFEDDHVYLVHGRPSVGSVTGLIHQYAQHFDGHGVATRMIQRRNWPQPGYLRNPVPCDVMQELVQHSMSGPLVQALRT